MTVGKIRLRLAVTEDFLDAVMDKFHFDREERECFFAVGRRVEETVIEEAGFWCSKTAGNVETSAVALTLGTGVDRLQEEYTKNGRLTECYMAEAIADELLLTAYREFNRWVEKTGALHVARYHFFGTQEELSPWLAAQLRDAGLSGIGSLGLEGIMQALLALGKPAVECNGAYCLTPKKSVVFLAELTAQEVYCEGVCAGCARKDCPNSCRKEQEELRLRWPDLTERALPYGYARILGGQ